MFWVVCFFCLKIKVMHLNKLEKLQMLEVKIVLNLRWSCSVLLCMVQEYDAKQKQRLERFGEQLLTDEATVTAESLNKLYTGWLIFDSVTVYIRTPHTRVHLVTGMRVIQHSRSVLSWWTKLGIICWVWMLTVSVSSQSNSCAFTFFVQLQIQKMANLTQIQN